MRLLPCPPFPHQRGAPSMRVPRPSAGRQTFPGSTSAHLTLAHRLPAYPSTHRARPLALCHPHARQDQPGNHPLDWLRRGMAVLGDLRIDRGQMGTLPRCWGPCTASASWHWAPSSRLSRASCVAGREGCMAPSRVDEWVGGRERTLEQAVTFAPSRSSAA